jgi:hypothetical protein
MLYGGHVQRRARIGEMAKMQKSYYVKALWDPEAKVWYSESDIPGLVIETHTLGEFELLMMDLAPEMLAENEGVHGANVPIDFQVFERREIAVA